MVYWVYQMGAVAHRDLPYRGYTTYQCMTSNGFTLWYSVYPERDYPEMVNPEVHTLKVHTLIGNTFRGLTLIKVTTREVTLIGNTTKVHTLIVNTFRGLTPSLKNERTNKKMGCGLDNRHVVLLDWVYKMRGTVTKITLDRGYTVEQGMTSKGYTLVGLTLGSKRNVPKKTLDIKKGTW